MLTSQWSLIKLFLDKYLVWKYYHIIAFQKLSKSNQRLQSLLLPTITYFQMAYNFRKINIWYMESTNNNNDAEDFQTVIRLIPVVALNALKCIK